MAAGDVLKLFATMLTIASSSAITTREAIAPLPRVTKSAAVFAGTSLILQ